MMRRGLLRLGMAVFGLVAVLTLAACGGSDDNGNGGSEGAAETGPIKIGAAIDQSQMMQFFDGPALTAAKIEADKFNKEGGIDGRKIEFQVKDTQLDQAKTKAAAESLIADGANIMWVTCDADWATPAIQEGINADLLTIAPCEGTGEIGVRRFGEKGKLAFSFGNYSADEGAALADLFWKNGWKTVNIVGDQSIVYEKLLCKAFQKRYEELGGKVVGSEKFTEGDGTINSVVNRINNEKADAIAICATAQEDLPTFVSGVRSAGNQTPIGGPWSIDGAFWLPKDPKISNNITLVTYASVYGDDPSPAVNQLVKKMTKMGEPPATGGFLGGAAAIDGIAAAVKENDGSTEGSKLAASIQDFSNFETLSGPINFSPELHTVFGREYRVIEIKDGKPRFVETIQAEEPVDMGN